MAVQPLADHREAYSAPWAIPAPMSGRCLNGGNIRRN
jgi:hypothetical protein